MPKLIAIIDDEAELEFLYSLIFERAIQRQIVELKFFQHPRDFLQWFTHHEPDLVLSDINMPEMSGPQLCQSIRSMGRSIPIYFVSGHPEQDYQEVLSEIGLCRFVSKPLNPAQFHGLVELDLNLPLA